MADIPSVTTFVMEAQLPWPANSSGMETKGSLEAGAIYESGFRRECTIHKISALGATICGELQTSPGEEVAIELATGQRPSGTIEWVERGQAGIRFKQPIDMLALLNRQLVNQPIERRTMPRVELRYSVGLKWGVNLAAATLRNISARGLQVEGENLPAYDTFISLFIDGLIVPAGVVVWRKGNLAGIELMEELSWSSIMPWIREVSRKSTH